MKTKLRKIGSGYGVLLPKKVIDNLRLSEGDELELTEAEWGHRTVAVRSRLCRPGGGVPADGGAAPQQLSRVREKEMTAVREMTARRLRRLDMRGLIAIHGELMVRCGGGASFSASSRSGEVDLPMLELSIARSELVVRERHWRSRARLAAGYGWRILTNRPFAEGNKRIALAAMVTFLEMNGFTWNCGEVEETAMLLHAAAGHMTEAEWEAWVVRNVGKKE